MTDAKSRSIRRHAGGVLVFGAVCAAAATNPGCGGGSGTPTGSTGSHTSSSSGTGGGSSCDTGPFTGDISPGANGGFSDAFDATPNADGSAVFFTGIDSSGNPGVFTQSLCPAGTVSAVYTGGQFEAPFGIAIGTDGKTLYVADLSAAEDLTDPSDPKDKGILFSLKASGGMAPATLAASVSPRSVTVHAEKGGDQVYFTGIDKSNGAAGVFKIAAAGGSVDVVAEGPPFSDPAGITVAANGDVYVVDTSGSASGMADIIVIPSGSSSATEFVPDLQVGYPAGIAALKDGSKLLVSGLTGSANADALTVVTVADKTVTNMSMGIGTFAEAAGLHRADDADVFAWADTKATPMGMTGTGTVFVIK